MDNEQHILLNPDDSNEPGGKAEILPQQVDTEESVNDISSTLSEHLGMTFSRSTLGIYYSEILAHIEVKIDGERLNAETAEKIESVKFTLGVIKKLMRKLDPQPFNPDCFYVGFKRDGGVYVGFDGGDLEDDPTTLQGLTSADTNGYKKLLNEFKDECVKISLKEELDISSNAESDVDDKERN